MHLTSGPLGGTAGQSLGKKVLDIRLGSDETGQPIGMVMAFRRDICRIVGSTCCYPCWPVPLWDAKRQTPADKIMKTVVVAASGPVRNNLCS